MDAEDNQAVVAGGMEGTEGDMGGDHKGRNLEEEQAFNENQAATLAETKKRRKEIERDAQLLANRIALLKQEEMKTWKKIEDTRKRTNEIVQLKNRNEERIQKKMYDFQLQNEENRQASTQNYMITKQRAEEKRKVQEAIFLSKREEAKQTKIIQNQNDVKKRHQDFKIETENRMKNQIVSQQKRLASLKIDEEKKRKIGQAQRQQNEKAALEDARRVHKEDEVMSMERVEMELIKKLQNTQAIQKEAYQELERALKEPSAMLTSYMKGGPAPGKQ